MSIQSPEIEKLREQALTSESAAMINEIAASIASSVKKTSDLRNYATKRSDIFHINPFLIHIRPGFNCRNFDDESNREHVMELAESIATKGVLRPLIVHLDKYDEKIYVVDGECRLLAVFYAIEKLGARIETVPAQAEARGVNEVERLASQVNHNSGKSLTALELAGNIKRLLAFGWNAEKITKETGVSHAKQYQLLELAGVPEDVKALINAGEVSPHLARMTVRRLKGEAAPILQQAASTAKADNRKKIDPGDIVDPPGKKMTPHRSKSFVIETISNLFAMAEKTPPDEDGAICVKFKEHEQIFLYDEYEALKISVGFE